MVTPVTRIVSALAWAALLLVPATAEAVSYVSGDYDYGALVVVNKSGCISSQSGSGCIIGGTLDVATPAPGSSAIRVRESESVSSRTGSNSVSVNALADLLILTSGDEQVSVRHSMTLRLSDSEPLTPHFGVQGRVRLTSSVIVDTTASLAPDQSLELSIDLSVDPAEVDTTFVAAYSVVDLDTGLTLGAFSETSPGEITIDISSIAGHQLEVTYDAEISANLPRGFAGGASGLGNRTFSTSIRASTGVRVVTPPVPEPSTALLLALGLLALGSRPTRARYCR